MLPGLTVQGIEPKRPYAVPFVPFTATGAVRFSALLRPCIREIGRAGRYSGYVYSLCTRLFTIETI